MLVRYNVKRGCVKIEKYRACGKKKVPYLQFVKIQYMLEEIKKIIVSLF